MRLSIARNLYFACHRPGLKLAGSISVLSPFVVNLIVILLAVDVVTCGIW